MLFPRQSSGRGVKQTRRPQPVPRLRMSEDMPPLLLSYFMTVQEKTLPLLVAAHSSVYPYKKHLDV